MLSDTATRLTGHVVRAGDPDTTPRGSAGMIHMTLILAALTLMYVSARSVADDEFKSRFLDPLIEDLHVTLVARNRYRGSGT